MQKILVYIVIGLLLGNIFIAFSQNTSADEIEKSVPYNSADNSHTEIVSPSSNRRLTLYDEDSSYPVIVCGEDDVLHMVWIDSRPIESNSTLETSTVFFKQSYDYGNTWTPDTALSVRTTEATSIDIASDGNYIAIVWEEGNDVFTLFSYDNGNSWVNPYMINSIESPSIALKGNDVYLVFKDTSQVAVPYLSGKRLTINPEQTNPVPYDFNPAGNNQICSIADVTTDENAVHVVIKDQAHSQLHYYSSQNDGITWSGEVIGDCFGEDVLGSVKIASRENSISIVWSDNREGNYNLYMKSSSDYGETWNDGTKLTESSGDSSNIGVVLDSKSEINLCWEESSDVGNRICYGKYDADSNELSITPITDGTSISSKPTITLDADDYYYMLWQDGRDVDEEIYFSTNLGEFDKKLDSIVAYIDSTPDSCYVKSQQKNALLLKLEAVRNQIDENEYTGVLNKLQNDILKKMDGYRNENLKDDWITDYYIQEELSNMISGLITSIMLKTESSEPIGGSMWCDVGTSTDSTVNYGICRYPNSEWRSIISYGGRTYMYGQQYCNFLVNIETAAWVRNIDYRVTFVYWASSNIPVYQWSGSSYNHIGTLPGKSNWVTYSLETNHLWNYDYLASSPQYNLLFEFRAPLYLDGLSFIPVEYHCNVGTSGDSALSEHDPGICLYPNTEWKNPATVDGRTCRLGELYPNIYVNSPNRNQEYRIEVNYKSKEYRPNGGTLKQWTGSYYLHLGNYICDQQWRTAIFITNRNYYSDYYGDSNLNVWFEFSQALYVESLKLTVARDYCFVGTSNDNVTTSHEPGASIYPNSEWGSSTTVDGRSCRYGAAYSNIYLNDIDTSKDYVIRIKYRSPSMSGEGVFRQWDGSAYRNIGTYITDNTWRTAEFIIKSFWQFDYNGAGNTWAMNALFEFSRQLWVQEISIGVMEKYALIMSGAASGDYCSGFWNDLQKTHDMLIGYGWSEHNVYCYLWNKAPGAFTGLDGSCNDNNVKHAFSEIGNKITSDDFFFFMTISHGFRNSIGSGFSIGPASPTKYIYYKGNSNTDNLMGPDYGGRIGNKPLRSVWLLHSCYSGMDPFSALGGVSGRIVISCAEDNEQAKTCGFAHQHWGFFRAYEVWVVWATWHDGFALSMGYPINPQTVSNAYVKGEYAATHNGLWGDSNEYHPRIQSWNCKPDETYW